MSQTGIEILNNNILLLSFLIVIPSAYALTDNKIITNDIPDIIKVLDLNKIEDGSIITNTQVTVTMEPKTSTLCFIKLLDESLNQIPISNNFPCKGTHTITLNQFGNWALETTLRKDNFKLGVGFVDDPKATVSFTISDYDISYNEPTYFAGIKDNKVVNVIVADQKFIDNIAGTWVETKIDGTIRGTYAGIGFDYDSIKDEFVDTSKIIIIDEPPSNATEG